MKRLCVALGVVLALISQSVLAEVPSFSSAQKEQIETIIHDYLVNNPKVLIEASRALQTKQREEMVNRAQDAIKANRKELLNDYQTFSGNTKGDVVLVEFFDYKCIHCKRMSSVVSDVSKEDKNLKVVYKQLPIFGGVSTYAAKAALASAKQNKYNAFHKALLEVEGNLEQADVLKLARKVGINTKRLQKDMKAKKIDAIIESNMKLAQKIGIMGTPAFIVMNDAQDDAAFKAEFAPGFIQKANLQNMISKARGKTAS